MGMLGSANDMQAKNATDKWFGGAKDEVVEHTELKVEMLLEMRKMLEEKHNLLNF